MYDIIFINPVKLRTGYSTLSIGTLMLATILENNGYKVKIVDFNYLWQTQQLKKSNVIEENIMQMYLYLKEMNTKIYGFSTNSSCHHIAIELSKLLKTEKIDRYIVFGGQQASLTAKETINNFQEIDVIAVGEGENIIIPLVDSLINNKSLNTINGIVYKDNDLIMETPPIDVVENIDLLPYLNYDLINLDIETDRKNNIAFPIEAGRSCPYQCTFCCTKTFFRKKFRLKSVDRIIDEIIKLQENYGVDKIHLLHDLFTFKKEYVLEFCNKIINQNINIKWICSARVDTLDEEVISKMYDAGCVKIFLGIETATEKLQKSIKKDLEIDKIWSVANLLKEYKIKVEAGFIYGFPDENEEDLNATLNMMIEGALKGLWFPEIGILNIENGTELYDELKDDLILENIDSIYMCDYDEIVYFKEMICNHKNIFPHFFDFKHITRQKYKYLDKFMWVISSLIYMGFHQTILCCLEHPIIDHDILRLYNMFLEVNGENFIKLFMPNYAIIYEDDKMINSIRINQITNVINYIDNMYKEKASSKVNILSDILKIESNKFYLRKTGEVGDIKRINFNYDFGLYLKSGIYDDFKKVIITLQKNEKNLIKVSAKRYERGTV